MFDNIITNGINASFKHLTFNLLLCIQSNVWLFCLLHCNINKYFMSTVWPPPFKEKNTDIFFLQSIITWFVFLNIFLYIYLSIILYDFSKRNKMKSLLSAFHLIPLLGITIGMRLRHITGNLNYLIMICNRLYKKMWK